MWALSDKEVPKPHLVPKPHNGRVMGVAFFFMQNVMFVASVSESGQMYVTQLASNGFKVRHGHGGTRAGVCVWGGLTSLNAPARCLGLHVESTHTWPMGHGACVIT